MSYTRRAFLLGGLATAASVAFNDFAGAISPDISHGPRSGKKVALTFHGAGDPAIANSLLNILSNTNTHVSVFAVGTFLKSNPEFAKILDYDGYVYNRSKKTDSEQIKEFFRDSQENLEYYKR